MGHRDLELHAVELSEAASELAKVAHDTAGESAWGRGIRVDTLVLAKIVRTLRLVSSCLNDLMVEDPGRAPYKKRNR